MRIFRLSEAALLLPSHRRWSVRAERGESKRRRYVSQHVDRDASATDSARLRGADPSQPDEPVGEGTGAVDDLLKLDVDQLANAACVPVEYTPAAFRTPRNVVRHGYSHTKEDIHRSGARISTNCSKSTCPTSSGYATMGK